MRYMGLDLGNRTVGVAFSDPLGIVATGYETYRFNEKDLQKVLEYVKMLVVERKVDKIVLGLPKNMDGSEGFRADACKELGYSVIMWSKDTIDWRDKDANLIYTRATNNISGGDFILAHPTECTLKSLPLILEYYKLNNFNATTVSECIK